MKDAYLPKISILLALLCPDDSIQILLILSQFRTLRTETKIRRICVESSRHNTFHHALSECSKIQIFVTSHFGTISAWNIGVGGGVAGC